MDRSPHHKDEFDFMDLLRKPRKLFGYSYVYFMLLLAGLGILYAGKLNDIGKNGVMPAVLKDSSAFIQDIPLQAPSVLPPVDVKQVAVPTDSLLRRGREVFRASCASCHGETGMGDGPAGLKLNPRPRNFHAAAGWTNGAKITEIYRTLQEGIVRNGMASYNYIPPADRFALIHLVRSFHPAPPAESEAEIQTLETTYQLSKGSVTAAQIPIREATQLVIAEGRAGAAETQTAADRLMKDSSPAAVLLRNVVADPAKAVTGLRAIATPGGSLDEFVHRVAADPGSLGLKPAITRLTGDEWSVLYEYIEKGNL